MELLGSIPTVWDETKIIDAKISDYIITARKKGNDWFIGGMTDWTAGEFDISLDFLPAGNYEATFCEDGVNADRYAADYTIHKLSVTNNSKLHIRMASGGGYLLRLIMK
jgi:alpha-glucosidase